MFEPDVLAIKRTHFVVGLSVCRFGGWWVAFQRDWSVTGMRCHGTAPSREPAHGRYPCTGTWSRASPNAQPGSDPVVRCGRSRVGGLVSFGLVGGPAGSSRLGDGSRGPDPARKRPAVDSTKVIAKTEKPEGRQLAAGGFKI